MNTKMKRAIPIYRDTEGWLFLASSIWQIIPNAISTQSKVILADCRWIEMLRPIKWAMIGLLHFFNRY